MAKANEENYDILISRISKIYGSAAVTREKLKQHLINEFITKNPIFQFGRINSIRMPYGQETKNQTHYFGFLTLLKYEQHEDLLKTLQQEQWKFGDCILKFEKAATMRIPIEKS